MNKYLSYEELSFNEMETQSVDFSYKELAVEIMLQIPVPKHSNFDFPRWMHAGLSRSHRSKLERQYMAAHS